jgi:predicted membrane channel-forming protein YqfA (hemolysin III family)
MVNIHDINSLNRPRFTSFVAIARIVNTSTIISTIMSLIALVGVMLVYISSRRKKFSIRLKMSISLAWLALASLAAWARCQDGSHDRKMEETDRK